MTPHLILFDFDGTLADSFSTTVHVANRLAAAHGYPVLTAAAAQKLRQQGARQILRESGIPIRHLPSWIRQMKKEMQNEIPHLKPPHGLADALTSLKDGGATLGIVTSNSRENLELFLQTNQWEDRFAHLESGSSLFGKSRLIKRIVTRSGYSPAQTCYVGDEERDIEAARRAGVAAAAVTWGFNDPTLLTRARPDYLINTPAELPQILFRNTPASPA